MFPELSKSQTEKPETQKAGVDKTEHRPDNNLHHFNINPFGFGLVFRGCFGMNNILIVIGIIIIGFMAFYYGVYKTLAGGLELKKKWGDLNEKQSGDRLYYRYGTRKKDL